ncbi:MAG TPA: GGDEF domain-containing protein [Candidatus Saccharimonadales bacterium]|nr:GGDEF domain-containing protein [Candidatus Saccharimonadales bacterium]
MEPRHRSRLQTLVQSADALARDGDLDAFVARLLELISTTLEASIGAVYLQDPDRTDLQLAVSKGLSDEERTALEEALGTAGDPVAATARDRTDRDFRARGEADGEPADGAFAHLGVVSAALRPLEVSRGGIELPMGVLVLGWRDARTLSAEDAELLHAIAQLAAVAIDRARLASMIAERSEWFERMAHTDPLTGLANQRTFARILELELARAARQGSEISVAVFDVDGLTAVNAAAGHEAGDDILRAVASVLAESVRLVDTVARYGGDEFVLIAPGSAGATVARRVLDGVAALPEISGRPVTVSAGVAQFPQDGASADELLAAAFAALDAARADGDGRIAAARGADSRAERETDGQGTLG